MNDNDYSLRRRAPLLIAVLVISGILLFVGSLIIGGSFPAWRWEHVAFHSLIKGAGALMALGIAAFILIRLENKSSDYRLWLACSMLIMGILHIFHASVEPGNEFVWFQSIAHLTGGVFMAMVWLSGHFVLNRLLRWLPGFLASAAVLLGVISLSYPEFLPAMLTNGGFTLTASIFSGVGGVLFLAGSLYFALLFYRSGSRTALLFCALNFLFGMAGITFEYSILWNAEWWLWHMMELAAFTIALGYVAYGSLLEYRQNIRMGQSLRESEQKYRSLIANIPDVVWTSNENGNTSFISANIEGVYGYTPEEIYNHGDKLWFGRIHSEDREKVKESFEAVFEKGQQLDLEYRIRRKDGEWIWIRDRSIGAYEKDGIKHADGVFFDITEYKKAQKALLDHQKQLRSLASELLLAEERLRRRMAVGVHDDIGQKLAVSKIKLQSLFESLSSPTVAKVLNEVGDLIAETIESSRSLTFELSPPVLYELGFEAAVKWLVRHTKQQHGLSVKFSDDGSEKPLDENVRVFLFQAVRELLVNVVKHAQAHRLKVSTQRVNGEIQVDVEDDGIGFNVSQIAFSNHKASGFGLFSIRERLGHIGGGLKIESGSGSGTKVTLTAPLNQKNTKGEEEHK